MYTNKKEQNNELKFQTSVARNLPKFVYHNCEQLTKLFCFNYEQFMTFPL